MGLARVPFAPSGRIDLVAHLRIQVDRCRVGPPRTAEIDFAGQVRRGRQRAVVEYKARVFGWIVFGLRGDESTIVGSAVDGAVVKDGLGIAEDEINIAGNVGIREDL